MIRVGILLLMVLFFFWERGFRRGHFDSKLCLSLEQTEAVLHGERSSSDSGLLARCVRNSRSVLICPKNEIEAGIAKILNGNKSELLRNCCLTRND